MPSKNDGSNWSDDDWKNLLRTIKYGKCTPFLGAGACHGVLPLGADIARQWTAEHGYPLKDFENLSKVAQFVAVELRDNNAPKYKIVEELENTKSPDFDKQGEPHGVLARLPLPVYITTNYDDFMVTALKRAEKEPEVSFCRWNELVRDVPTVFENDPAYQPTVQKPIVFHLHGNIDNIESMVLTEDDYLDFLVNISKERDLIPARIQRAFRESSLLFLGYSLEDVNFRVLFRYLAEYMQASVRSSHVSVQLVPAKEGASQEDEEKTRDYLDRYFRGLKIRMYWTTCEQFAKDLQEKWEAFNAK